MPGALYVVATPIGNLKDITLRALEVLKAVSCIACEDTRVTTKLLRHYGISKPLISYHEHNERARARQLLERLLAGDSIALVSDAGTPGLSDPGAHLVSEAAVKGIACVPVPGPSALSAIVAVAGRVVEPLVFVGFAPSRVTQRQKFLRRIQAPGTYCFYESPHRIVSFLRQLEEEWENPPVVMGRELTKVHEEILRGSAQELAGTLEKREYLRGELVLLVQKSEPRLVKTPLQSLQQEFEQLLAAGEGRKSALRLLARRYGISRKEIYRRLLKLEP
ncbi:MAG: 16S rRNA (cytidine(1402)-2'-O)-methyltransferase [Acidobacteria bacterium]|nr:16S rRNA (cytidine(1402)-2'-O)-methyltransferase [Acidobacteriota bacterium]